MGAIGSGIFSETVKKSRGYDRLMSSREPRLSRLRDLMRASGDPVDGVIQQRYHKSDLEFFGLKAARQREIVREVFPKSEVLSRDEHLPLIRRLWTSSYFDERVAALLLLARMVGPA